MAQKASAPDIERMHPETLMRSLLILMTCSAWLFDPAVDYAWCGC
jgi:hypothetical protein